MESEQSRKEALIRAIDDKHRKETENAYRTIEENGQERFDTERFAVLYNAQFDRTLSQDALDAYLVEYALQGAPTLEAFIVALERAEIEGGN